VGREKQKKEKLTINLGRTFLETMEIFAGNCGDIN
jgi:hypothetical protein